MEKTTEKLQPELIETLRKLKNRQGELVLNLGQVHLELKQLSKIQASMEDEHEFVSKELQKELLQLEEKYPEGEIDLNDGTVTF